MIPKLYRLKDFIRFCNVTKVNSYRCSHSISFYKNQKFLIRLFLLHRSDVFLLDLILVVRKSFRKHCVNIELLVNLVQMMKTIKWTTDGGNSAGDNIMGNFNKVKFRGAATFQLVE